MNILFMSNSLGRRFGYSVVASRVTDYLQKQGHQMIFFGMQDIKHPEVLPNGVLQLGVRYDPFGGDVAEDYARIYKADAFMSMLDLWLPQTAYMPDMCNRLKIPFVAHTTINSQPLSPYLAERFARADFIVAPSKYNARVLAEGGLGGKTFYIPHAVDLKTFYPNPYVKDEVKKALHIEGKEFIGVVVNRNKGLQKRLHDAMKMWGMICNQDPDFKKKAVLLMVHDPLEPDGFRTDIYRDRLGMNDNIKFIWQKPDFKQGGNDMVMTFEGDPEGLRHNANISLPPSEIAKLFNTADVSIVSSQSESYCLPAVESMACGTPVVMGNHSVGPEHIGETGGGLLVNIAYNETTALMSEVMNCDLTDFANKVYAMYKDEKLKKECGKKGLEYARKCGWDDVLPLWKALFEQVDNFRNQCNYQYSRMGL